MRGADWICDGVFVLLDELRSNPKSFIPLLQQKLTRFKGKDYYQLEDNFILTTEEGASAVEDAIKFLREIEKAEPLKHNGKLDQVAQAWSEELKSSGSASHGDFSKRITKVISSAGVMAETIVFWQKDPCEIVAQLLIDDGVQNRSHRGKLFSSKYEEIGVGFSTHPKYEYCCVINFVGPLNQHQPNPYKNYKSKSPLKAKRVHFKPPENATTEEFLKTNLDVSQMFANCRKWFAKEEGMNAQGLPRCPYFSEREFCGKPIHAKKHLGRACKKAKENRCLSLQPQAIKSKLRTKSLTYRVRLPDGTIFTKRI